MGSHARVRSCTAGVGEGLDPSQGSLAHNAWSHGMDSRVAELISPAML